MRWTTHNGCPPYGLQQPVGWMALFPATGQCRIDTDSECAPKGTSGHSLIQVALSSVYLSKACRDLSRPLPDCLKPPNGAVMSPPSYWLTHTLPARSALAVKWALDRLLVHTAAASP